MDADFLDHLRLVALLAAGINFQFDLAAGSLLPFLAHVEQDVVPAGTFGYQRPQANNGGLGGKHCRSDQEREDEAGHDKHGSASNEAALGNVMFQATDARPGLAQSSLADYSAGSGRNFHRTSTLRCAADLGKTADAARSGKLRSGHSQSRPPPLRAISCECVRSPCRFAVSGPRPRSCVRPAVARAAFDPRRYARGHAFSPPPRSASLLSARLPLFLRSHPAARPRTSNPGCDLRPCEWNPHRKLSRAGRRDTARWFWLPASGLSASRFSATLL